ncbi:unnamed protein product, partial [marine sediment metagenome]
LRSPGDRADEDIPRILPLLPLKETVIFPATVTPVAVGKPRSLAAVEKAMAGERILGAVPVKPSVKGGGDEVYDIGTAVSIVKLLSMPDGTLRILVQGLEKIRIAKVLTRKPFFSAEVDVLKETYERSDRIEVLMRNVLDRVSRIVSTVTYLPDELQTATMNIENPILLVYLIATSFRLKFEDRQAILETPDVEEKLGRVLKVLDRELELLEIGGKIEDQVKTEMSKTQREYYLREQLKAIKKELGEGDEMELEANEILDKLDRLKLP